MAKSLLFRSIVTSFRVGVVLYALLAPSTIIAETANTNTKFCMAKYSYEVAKTVTMIATGYSSTVDQTDDTPFITASGKKVADGIVANNMLPFGTKVRIPELYGDKIFVVEDRMHTRKGKYHADIWFSDYQTAKEFGAKLVDVEVLES